MGKTGKLYIRRYNSIRVWTVIALLALFTAIGFCVALNSIATSALLVAAIICMLALWKPKVGLWGLLAILPFIYFLKRVEFYLYQDPTSEYNNPVSVLPEIIILVLLVSIGLRSVDRSLRFRFLSSRLTRSTLIFLGVCLLQVANPFSSLTIGLYGFRVFGYYTLAFFLGQYLLRSERDIRRFMALSLTMSSLVALYGLWQQFIAVPPWDKVWVLEFIPEPPYSWLAGAEFSWRELRKFSLLKTPVSTALFYVFNILFCVTLYQWKRRFRFILIALVLLSALVFTYIRGGWLALASAMIIVAGLWWLRRGSSSKSPSFITVVLLLAMLGGLVYLGLKLSAPIAATLGSGLGRRLSSLADPLNTSEIQARLQMWERAWALVRMHPLGVGIGATGGVGQRFSGFGVVDNLYLKLCVELGWAGVLLFGMVIWQASRHAWYVYVQSQNVFHRLIAISAMGFISVILVDGIVAPSLEYDIAAIYFWLWLGVLDRIPVGGAR